jgi:hypothetical protein
MTDKKMGFFNSDEKQSKSSDIIPVPKKGYNKEYKPPLEPLNPDDKKIAEQIDYETKSESINIQQKSDVRKTMRVPEEQFFEFMALLDASEYSYVYELLGDMIDQRMSKLDSSELRVYQSALESIKRTENKKKQRKRK